MKNGGCRFGASNIWPMQLQEFHLKFDNRQSKFPSRSDPSLGVAGYRDGLSAESTEISFDVGQNHPAIQHRQIL
jgi:hypothetical protein